MFADKHFKPQPDKRIKPTLLKKVCKICFATNVLQIEIFAKFAKKQKNRVAKRNPKKLFLVEEIFAYFDFSKQTKKH